MQPRNVGFLLCVCVMLLTLFACTLKESGKNPAVALEKRSTQSNTDLDRSRILKLEGVLKDRKYSNLGGVIGVLFAIYEQQQGGAPLWQEVQNVEVDKRRHFTAMVGTETLGGIPRELFSEGKPCWLGMQVMQPGQVEWPRMRLVSTPSGLTVQRGVSQMIAQEGSGETVGSQPDQNESADRPRKARRRFSR